VNWEALAKTLDFHTTGFVGGEFLAGRSSREFWTENPATGEALAGFADTAEKEINLAVTAARGAFPGWSRLNPVSRKELLLELAQAMRRQAKDLALRDTLEMGKPITMALAEVEAAAEFLQFYAELADKLYGEVSPMDSDSGFALTRYEPRGVVGVITPWNFPMMTTVSAVAPALAAGNTVVQKPSEHSPSSALLLAQLAVQVGIAPGVLNVVPGRGETAGVALARHEDVDKLHFTGRS